MMRRRVVAAVAALAVGQAAALAGAAAPARAAATAACNDKIGVTVVVDFTKLHGKVRWAARAGSRPPGWLR